MYDFKVHFEVIYKLLFVMKTSEIYNTKKDKLKYTRLQRIEEKGKQLNYINIDVKKTQEV